MLEPADEANLLNLVYEASSELSFLARSSFSSDTQKKKNHVDSDRIAEYDMKLIGIHTNTLGIPETEYKACLTTASNKITRIVHHDLSQLGDSFRIEVNKEGIRFASEGEARQW